LRLPLALLHGKKWVVSQRRVWPCMYEVVLDQEAILWVHNSSWRNGWRCRVVDANEHAVFSTQRKLRWLLLHKMMVHGVSGALLGQFVQRVTGLSIHFDVLNEFNENILQLVQSADERRVFHFWAQGAELARVVRLPQTAEQDWRLDEYEVTVPQLTSQGTDEEPQATRNPVQIKTGKAAMCALMVAGVILIDRLYFSNER
jgi:hypothetical protein